MKVPCRPKNYVKIPRLTEQNFAKEMSFLAIFHTPQTCRKVWKVLKQLNFRTVWPA